MSRDDDAGVMDEYCNDIVCDARNDVDTKCPRHSAGDVAGYIQSHHLHVKNSNNSCMHDAWAGGIKNTGAPQSLRRRGVPGGCVDLGQGPGPGLPERSESPEMVQLEPPTATHRPIETGEPHTRATWLVLP